MYIFLWKDALKPWVRDLHKVQISDFSDFRGCVWRGYGRHRGSCVMPLAWVGHEIWYKNKNRTLFQKHFFFDEHFIFEEIWKSKILNKKKSHFSKKKYHFFSLIFHWKKWLFWRNFSDFFSREKIFFVQLFVSKKSSNYFLKTNFWSRFFSNICAVWFPVDWACFWINPGHQKRSSSIFGRGGATGMLPPLVEISDSGL